MSGPTQKTRLAVYQRDEGCCVRCGKYVYDIHGERALAPLSLQHRKARGMGGSKDPLINAPENLILLCGTGTTECHGWVESNREEARELGYAISQYEDPALVPVAHPWFGMAYLTRFGYALVQRDALVDRVIRERDVVCGSSEHIALLDWLHAA